LNQTAPTLSPALSPNGTPPGQSSPAPSNGRPARDARLFIVEDHPVVREAYLGLLQDTPGFEVAGTASSAEEALEVVPDAGADLLLVDISLPGMSGLDLIATLLAEDPTVRALVVSGHEQAVYGSRAYDVGAVGYVVKADGPMALIEAIRQALA
jgi:two-component system, NarL family, invasion response regulator UvrY